MARKAKSARTAAVAGGRGAAFKAFDVPVTFAHKHLAKFKCHSGPTPLRRFIA